MDDQHAVAVARDGEDRLLVERRQAPQIEHRRFNAFGRQLVRDAHAVMHVGAVGNHGDVAAGSPQRGLADRHR